MGSSSPRATARRSAETVLSPDATPLSVGCQGAVCLAEMRESAAGMRGALDHQNFTLPAPHKKQEGDGMTQSFDKQGSVQLPQVLKCGPRPTAEGPCPPEVSMTEKDFKKCKSAHDRRRFR